MLCRGPLLPFSLTITMFRDSGTDGTKCQNGSTHGWKPVPGVALSDNGRASYQAEMRWIPFPPLAVQWTVLSRRLSATTSYCSSRCPCNKRTALQISQNLATVLRSSCLGKHLPVVAAAYIKSTCARGLTASVSLRFYMVSGGMGKQEKPECRLGCIVLSRMESIDLVSCAPISSWLS